MVTKKTFVISALLAMSITAGAQEFFQDSKNPGLLCPCGYQADHRKDTVLPAMSSIRLSVGKGDSTLIVSCDNRAEKEIFVDNLLKQMTLREKLGQMTQVIPETGVITGPEGTPMNIEAQIKAGEVGSMLGTRRPEDMALCRKEMKFAQEVKVPTCAAEDVQGVMAQGYWDVWNDEEQKRIDADIDAYRKADAMVVVGRVKKGTKVKVEQVQSEFIFGASAFNWNQLGNPEANARYRELFGTLFNRATVPFYWKEFELKPGSQRFEESFVDTEEWWNRMSNPMRQPHWRRPATDPIVDWCIERGVKVHGHPLVWGNRKWHHPIWLQYEGIPDSERKALDSLEVITFRSNANRVEGYKKMTPEQIAAIVPTYIKSQEERTEKRIRDIMTYYAGKIDSWDVVNESSKDFSSGSQNPAYPMCKSRYGIMPSDYTFRSLQIAHKYNTWGSLLNINDFVVDERVINQAADLFSRGAKIDVLGSQMHLFEPQQCLDIAAGKHIDPSEKLVEPSTVRPYFEKLGSFGVPVCLSEITITSAGEGERGEMIQAIISRNLYRLWFSLPSMMGITWWNIVDNCGAPGEPNISGIFNRDMTPKAVYFVLDQLINHEWKTNIELQPDRRGNISWRGFKGTYRITWTAPDGKEMTKDFVLE